MAEHYLQANVRFRCSNSEMALLEEIFQAASDLMGGFDPGAPSAEILKLFPAEAADDPWSGLRAIFCDAGFPDFGAELVGGNSLDVPHITIATIYGMHCFQTEPVAAAIQRCCRETLERRPIGFEWSTNCSRPHGDFGGGWCAIFKDRIELTTTREALSYALAGSTIPDGNVPVLGHWDDHPDHTAADWKYEVANDDTRLGYPQWVAARLADDSEMPSEPD